MVDKDKLRKRKQKSKDTDSTSSENSGTKQTKKKKKSSKKNPSTPPDTFEMTEELTSYPGDATVSETSEQWSANHGELNFHVEGGESRKQYVARQIKECEEFYENYAERATSNMEDINQFTLYYHALTISMARNRIGIMDTLINNFGDSKKEAFALTKKICQEAGEEECMLEVIDEMTWSLIGDD